MKSKILIKKEESGNRIDKFLTQRLGSEKETGFIRADFIRAIRNGKILINGKKIKPAYILKEGDVIKVEMEKKEKGIIPNPKVDFEIIYHNENFAVINKPAGLLTHPTEHGETDTLVNGLVARFPEILTVHDDSPESWKRPGIVHRLDKDTSGILIVALNQKTLAQLKKLFQEKKIQKKYWAVVRGKIAERKGVIDIPIARASNYRKQIAASGKTRAKIRSAVTEYEVLREGKNYSLVEIFPRTGRTHQIRLHFFTLGHSIAGDKLYGKKRKGIFSAEKFSRQLLHAKEISFELYGQKYSFTAALPEDMKKALRENELLLYE